MFGALDRTWKPGQMSYAQPDSDRGCGATETLNLPPLGEAATSRLPSGLAIIADVAAPPTTASPATSAGT